MVYKGVEKELWGGELETTNNRMELMAAIEGLRALKRECEVVLTTDSQYVMKGINEWMANWKKRGWKTAAKEPVKTLTCGASSTSRSTDTRSPGNGCAGISATLATNAPTSWPTAASTRYAPSAELGYNRRLSVEVPVGATRVEQQNSRFVVLDTETTGMPVSEGHRIIEIGCVEVMGRRLTGRHFHVYLQPDRESDEGAIGVHGITDAFLVGKPRFAEVAEEFFEFIQGAQLVIHNAAFDVGFINNEFAMLGQHDRADISSTAAFSTP